MGRRIEIGLLPQFSSTAPPTRMLILAGSQSSFDEDLRRDEVTAAASPNALSQQTGKSLQSRAYFESLPREELELRCR